MRCPTKAETLSRPCPTCRGWAHKAINCQSCAGCGVIHYRYGKVILPKGNSHTNLAILQYGLILVHLLRAPSLNSLHIAQVNRVHFVGWHQ